MIVDGYCDVCGGPAGAVPFVPAAASAASPLLPRFWPNGSPGADTSPPAPTDEEILDPADPSGEDAETAVIHTRGGDPGTADPGAIDAQQVDREKVGPAADDTWKVDGVMRTSPRASPTAPMTIERESRRPNAVRRT